jgi:hypothetical protein
MKTRTKVHAVQIALLTAGWLSSVQAMDEIATVPKAYGTTSATLICKKTKEGMQVVHGPDIILSAHSHEATSATLPDSDIPTIIVTIQPGDSCLKAMAQLPRPFPELSAYFNPDGNGTTTRTREYILRPVIRVGIDTSGAESVRLTGFGTFSVRHVVACGPGEEGQVVTVAVYSDGPSDTSYVGIPCGETLGMLASGGAKIGKPVTGSLGYDAAGNLRGGLTWVLTSANDIEVVECNLDTSGELVVALRENTGGVDTDAVGQSCLAMLSTSQLEGRKLTSATPAPAGGTTVDPDYLIWDINGVGR